MPTAAKRYVPTMGHDPKLGREAILSGSRNNFINRCIADSDYFILTAVLKAVFFVDAITCSDTGAMSASQSHYEVMTQTTD